MMGNPKLPGPGAGAVGQRSLELPANASGRHIPLATVDALVVEGGRLAVGDVSGVEMPVTGR